MCEGKKELYLRTSHIFPIALFFGFFVLGFSTIGDLFSQPYEVVKVSVDDRFPAAFRSGLDLNKATKEPLKLALKDQFLEKAAINNTMDFAKIQFSQFAEVDTKGKKNLSCLVYDRVVVTFEAEGVASGGVKPQLEIESLCSFKGNDITQMNEIKVPVAALLGQDSKSQEYTFAESPGVVFRMKYALGDWPKSWFLKKVEFKSPQKTHTFSTDEYMSAKGPEKARHLFMRW